MEFLREQLKGLDDRQPMTVYCLLCPKWKATGTAEETRVAAETHRLETHPEIRVEGKRLVKRRHKFSSSLTADRLAEVEEERRQRMRELGLA
jgi:hypothetical protein